MEVIMRRFMFAAALFAALACLSLPLRAETLIAKVPFDFYMDNSTLPAGEYRVDLKSQFLVMVRNSQGKGAVFSIVSPAERPASQTKGLLVFHKIGEEYFLVQVWTPDSIRGHKLRESAREEEAYARANRADGMVVASIPLRHQ